MTTAIYTKVSGSIKKMLQVNTKVGGTIKRITAVYTRVSGVLKKIYPEAATSFMYSTPGTYTVSVPAGCYYPTFSVYGGGGGGECMKTDGGGLNIFMGGAGGSGGKRVNQVAIVVPGETLTVVVGGGGVAGLNAFGSTSIGSYATAGGLSSVAGSFGTVSSGGGGAGGKWNGSVGAGGSGGSPDGVAGESTEITLAGWPYTGGATGSGYGNGGGGAPWNGIDFNGLPGTAGNVLVTFTADTIYTSPGTTNVTVPPGCYSITYTIYGGGGGGGCGYSWAGMQWSSGGGGGSGGKREATVAVVPGETLTVVVGAKGVKGSNAGAPDTLGSLATDGTSSSLSGSFGTLTSTGGIKGGRASQNLGGSSGAGGTPSGGAGVAGHASDFLIVTSGGTNGSGYGNGGAGWNTGGANLNGVDGANGRVSITFHTA